MSQRKIAELRAWLDENREANYAALELEEQFKVVYVECRCGRKSVKD